MRAPQGPRRSRPIRRRPETVRAPRARSFDSRKAPETPVSGALCVPGAPGNAGTPWYRRLMDRITAFGDDALGDLDAVGLVEALHAGTVSAGEVVDAAISRLEAVNPALNGLAYEA